MLQICGEPSNAVQVSPLRLSGMQDEQLSEPMQNEHTMSARESLQFQFTRDVIDEIHRLRSVLYFKVMKEIEFSASKLALANLAFNGSELALILMAVLFCKLQDKVTPVSTILAVYLKWFKQLLKRWVPDLSKFFEAVRANVVHFPSARWACYMAVHALSIQPTTQPLSMSCFPFSHLLFAQLETDLTNEFWPCPWEGRHHTVQASIQRCTVWYRFCKYVE